MLYDDTASVTNWRKGSSKFSATSTVCERAVWLMVQLICWRLPGLASQRC